MDTAQRVLTIRRAEQRRLQRIEHYVRGRHDSVYVPRGAKVEYKWLVKRSVVNYMPLVISVIAENLHIDGYRPTPSGEVADDLTAVLSATHAQILSASESEREGIISDAADQIRVSIEKSANRTTQNGPWQCWQANRLGSRQHGLWRAIIKYGCAYSMVLPDTGGRGGGFPKARFISPRRITALYEDPVDSEWPDFAVEEFELASSEGTRRVVRLYDDQYVYTLLGKPNSPDIYWPEEDDPFLPSSTPVVAYHGSGICPVVRWPYQIDLDGEEDVEGEVWPLIALQDQINTTTFNLLMAQQYGAFRQRWIAGMVPVDENNRPRQPFRSGVDRLWIAEDPTTKFGEFGQTDLKDFLNGRTDSIRHVATIAQVPPYHLLGQVANLSADALTAARDGLDRKIEEIQSTQVEAAKQHFRLQGKASGDQATWADPSAEILWRDTGARAFAATVDGLTKLTQGLGVPATQLWTMIPGVTQEQVDRWKRAVTPDVLEQLDRMLAAQLSGPGQPMSQVPGGQVSDDEPYATAVRHPEGF
jgi:hypothetical protein